MKALTGFFFALLRNFNIRVYQQLPGSFYKYSAICCTSMHHVKYHINEIVSNLKRGVTFHSWISIDILASSKLNTIGVVISVTQWNVIICNVSSSGDQSVHRFKSSLPFGFRKWSINISIILTVNGASASGSIEGSSVTLKTSTSPETIG